MDALGHGSAKWLPGFSTPMRPLTFLLLKTSASIVESIGDPNNWTVHRTMNKVQVRALILRIPLLIQQQKVEQ